MSLWQHLETVISDHTGQSFGITDNDSMAGGCISSGSRVSDGQRTFFVKTNRASLHGMFEAEALGLNEIVESATIKAPEAIAHGIYEQASYIVMEYLELGGSVDSVLLGQKLAAMHRTHSDQFGWKIDNTIGSTPQPNNQSDDWISFWRTQRLKHQLDMAAGKGYGGDLQSSGERLLSDFDALFESYSPSPSMLHGDLWSGNYGGLHDGTPVIYDPAFYFGDREADLAMTTLFGGFSRDFYSAYEESYPLDDGYPVRKDFYNIYHVINHLNLFGGGYLGQAVNLIKRVLSEIR